MSSVCTCTWSIQCETPVLPFLSTSSAALTFAWHASRASSEPALSTVAEAEGLDSTVLGACDSTAVVLDAACGPAVVASGQNFHAANKPPTRTAAATASGMMTRAGRAFARRACTTFPPKRLPRPHNLLENARRCETNCPARRSAAAQDLPVN